MIDHSDDEFEGFIIQPEDKSMRPRHEDEPAESDYSDLEETPVTDGTDPDMDSIPRLPGGGLDIDDDDIIFDGTWEAVISQDETDQVRESCGLVKPDFESAHRVFPQQAYGWYPSISEALWLGIEPDELYDPVAALVSEAIEHHDYILPSEGDFELIANRIVINEDGFATEYRAVGDLFRAKYLVKFIAGYWAPKRNFYLATTWREIPAKYTDTGSPEVTVLFRWLSRADESAWKITEEEARVPLLCDAPFTLRASGALIENKRRSGPDCPICGNLTEIWVAPEMADSISAWQWTGGKLPSSLPASDREMLISGTHPWCWPGN